MRISDWSSDVCSSDLQRAGLLFSDAVLAEQGLGSLPKLAFQVHDGAVRRRASVRSDSYGTFFTCRGKGSRCIVLLVACRGICYRFAMPFGSAFLARLAPLGDDVGPFCHLFVAALLAPLRSEEGRVGEECVCTC